MSRTRETRRLNPGTLLMPAALSLFIGQWGIPLDAQQNPERPRARDLGIQAGILTPGPLNAITDVRGVEVGQTTVIRGNNIRTGITVVLPHPGNLFQEKVPGAVFVGNAFGKLMGSTQINELGEIETPIVLTSTLSVWRMADALVDYMLTLPGNEHVLSINPVVGETNDGRLNDIRARALTREDLFGALRNARGGPVEEGSVGAGTGTTAFGFKGGIGTASRRLPESLGGYTVGVLVQTNFGGVLTINGAPVGRELGTYYLKDELERTAGASGTDHHEAQDRANGSVMVVVATDTPLDWRNLHRLAARTMAGIARTGSAFSNGSGDFAVAFSTCPCAPDGAVGAASGRMEPVANDNMSPLFLAAIEATEEAVYNSLFKATTVTGNGATVEALPIDKTVAIMKRYGAISAPGGKSNANPSPGATSNR